MDHPTVRPRPPDDSYPSGGVSIEQEINCICYELLVRRPLGKFVVVIRCYDNEEIGISVRRV